MRHRALAVALMLTAGAVPGTAHAGEVTGTVTDIGQTRALQAAEVRIVELGRTVTTNRDGSFRFPDIPAGTYTLEATYIGAPTYATTVTVTESGAVVVPVQLGVNDGSDILVIGQAANQASSLARQRAADGVSSVLTRDGIGQFPDQNVAESIRRLPGVNILNDQGEGRFVSVRGLDPELNAASINGVRIPGPGSDERQVALDVISSDIIESIEIKKSLTPDMDADTIGASIEINTTSAFDRAKDLFAVRVEGSYNDLSDRLTPKASFDFSTKLSDDIGVAGGFSYYNRKFESDNLEAEGWKVEDGILFADELAYRDYDVERERISATLNFDFRASDTTKLFVRGLFSQFDDQEYRRQTIFEMDGDPRSGDLTRADFNAQDGEIVVLRDLKDRFERQRIRTISAGGITELNGWRFDYLASWAKSSELENKGSIDPITFERAFEDEDFGVSFDYSRPKIIRYSITSGNADFLDPSQYEFDELELTALSKSVDEEYAFKADVARTFFMDGGEFTVKFGGKARLREKSFELQSEVYDGFDGAEDLTLASAGLLGTQTYRLADISPILDKFALRRFFDSNRSSFELNAFDSLANSSVEAYRFEEDIYAGYLLGRWDSSTLRVIGGIRMEHTRNNITTNLVELVEEGGERNGAEVTEDTVFVSPVNFNRRYSDWLPSLTVRFEPQPGLVLRTAGYKSLVRPRPAQVAPRGVFEDNEAEFGNPNLRPFRAWNFDLSAEYYFGSNAAISAGFFYKDIKDYTVELFDGNPGNFNGIPYDEATTFVNGESAEIFGFEASYNQVLSFLPAPFDGLLLQANYTFTDSSGSVLENGLLGNPRNIALPTTSRHVVNGVIGYEKGPLSMRLSGTYRDLYLDEIAAAPEEDRFVSEHFQLDFSARLKILDNVRVFTEVINITDRPYFAYQNFAGGRRLLQFEEYSFTVKFGVTANF
jgi:TonB-dependent receptor